MKKLQLTGLKFGKWLVINEAGINKSGHVIWNCKCDCGTEKTVIGNQLKSGWSKSCGCLSREEFIIRETTHGKSKHSLYNIYRGMKQRCYNVNCIAYKDYGGRGIKICDFWLEDFQNFYKDMADTYKPGLTIERKEVNGNYCKDNCVWETRANQAKNRRTNNSIETELGILTIAEAARIAGVSWFCIYNRYKRKCPIEKLLLPANKVGRNINNAIS